MSFTADSRVVGVDPDLSAATFGAILSAAASPAAAEAAACYAAVTRSRVSPAYVLAVFEHESRMGTDPASVDVRYGTKNPGNDRTIRDPNAKGSVIQTDRGPFVAYQSWADGFADLAARLTDPSYVYAQAGAVTPATIIPISAPPSDGNDPATYIAAVVASMNAYVSQQGGPMTTAQPAGPPAQADPDRPSDLFGLPVELDPAADGNWEPDRGTVILFVVHDEEADGAQSAVNRFQTPGAQASVHFVPDVAGAKMRQCVALDHTAYSVGNLAYNKISDNCENAGYAGKPYLSDEIDQCARAGAYCSRYHGYPVTRLAKMEVAANKPGFCGHEDIPNPNIPIDQLDPNNPDHWGGQQNHRDPGPTWPWDGYLQLVNHYRGDAPLAMPVTTGAPSDTRYFPETHHYLSHGFKAYWELFADKSVALFGYPISEEFHDQTLGTTVQWFERARFEWRPGEGLPFDVQLGRVGAEDAAAAKAANPAAFAPAGP